jgi:hypothetical protein
MFEVNPKVKHAMLLSLLGATILGGTSGIVMSAKALVVTAHANCGGLRCSSPSDCGSCYCNNPDNGTNGTCQSTY